MSDAADDRCEAELKKWTCEQTPERVVKMLRSLFPSSPVGGIPPPACVEWACAHMSSIIDAAHADEAASVHKVVRDACAKADADEVKSAANAAMQLRRESALKICLRRKFWAFEERTSEVLSKHGISVPGPGDGETSVVPVSRTNSVSGGDIRFFAFNFPSSTHTNAQERRYLFSRLFKTMVSTDKKSMAGVDPARMKAFSKEIWDSQQTRTGMRCPFSTALKILTCISVMASEFYSAYPRALCISTDSLRCPLRSDQYVYESMIEHMRNANNVKAAEVSKPRKFSSAVPAHAKLPKALPLLSSRADRKPTAMIAMSSMTIKPRAVTFREASSPGMADLQAEWAMMTFGKKFCASASDPVKAGIARAYLMAGANGLTQKRAVSKVTQKLMRFAFASTT